MKAVGVQPSPAAWRAWRALRDCGVIRAHGDHPGFAELFDRGVADCRCVKGTDKLDWRLT